MYADLIQRFLQVDAADLHGLVALFLIVFDYGGAMDFKALAMKGDPLAGAAGFLAVNYHGAVRQVVSGIQA
jgi:hypothetical protein